MRRTPLALAGALLAAGLLAAPSLSAATSVKIGDDYFVRSSGHATVTIKKGASLTWHWTGHAAHHVAVKSGPAKFNSKTQTSGSYSHKFTKAGTYNIYCTIHQPDMTMKVVVK